MRRKPAQQGANPNFNNNQHRSQKQRSFGGGSGGGQQYNRPRKNYGQAREKYLAQARDAMAAGDRVLAENYLQHADHCYRMMMEEGQHRQARQPQVQNEQVADDAGNVQGPEGEEEITNNSALPAFITGGFDHAATGAGEAAAVPVQDWEDRDSQ